MPGQRKNASPATKNGILKIISTSVARCVRTASRNHFCAISENGAENATEPYRQTNASSAYISNAMTRKNRMSGMVEMNVVAR